MGENAKFMVTGDMTQVDLPKHQKSGLKKVVDLLDGTDGISFIRLDGSDVIRHSLVRKIITAFDKGHQPRSTKRIKKIMNDLTMTTNKALTETNFNLPGQTKFYRGKVRDVYTLEDGRLVMVASDRISAFDVVLPEAIPYKGQVLNQIAGMFLDKTSDIVKNWKEASPDPNVTVGMACEPFRIEMVIRGYLTGHAWRTYKSGLRELCGVALPEGMKEHDRFPEPIITPATKADEGT